MKNANILVVDDETAILELFRSIFKDTGHKVETVECGQKALEAIKKKNFEIVFLDVVMQGMDGFQVLTEIKKIKPDINVAMMTGSKLEEGALEVTCSNWDGFFSKPFDVKRILDYVDESE